MALLDSGNGYIGEKQSVFQAETVGIHKACERLQTSNAKSITIFSDSQFAISAIAGWIVRSKTVSNCVKALNNLATGKKVIIKYIKAHVGFLGNETADALAKQGTKNTLNKIVIPQPNSWAKMLLKKETYEQWASRWYQCKIGRQTKIWFPSLNIKGSKILASLPRADLGLAIQMLSGHNRLNRHENLCNPEVSPLCRKCGEEEESSWHVIALCPALVHRRGQSFKKYFLEDPPDWKAAQLLDFLKNEKVAELNTRS